MHSPFSSSLKLSRLRRLLTLAVVCAWCTTTLAQPMAPLLQAAQQGEWGKVGQLLTEGANVNEAYGDGSTALHWSSYYDDSDAARQLLAAGANVNAVTDLGVTPLWLAAENASVAMTALLLQAGADPSLALLAGETPLATASLTGSAQVVKLLLKAGADPDVTVSRQQTALMWAAGQGHGEIVEALLAAGADVEARTEVRNEYVKTEKEQDSHTAYKQWVEEGGYSALMFAAATGNLASVQALVRAGSDVNGPSAAGITPAIMAVHGGNASVVDSLLEAGARVDEAPGGYTALHTAVLRGNLAVVQTLLDHGAQPDPVLEKPTRARRQSSDYHFHDSLIGATPLWLAARFSEPAIMQALLQAGADPDTVNRVSYPAQRMGNFFMAEEGDMSILMAAVGMGNRRLRLSWGTPERRAGQLGRDQEARILEAAQIAVQAGVDINLQDAEGQTALDFARARRYQSVVAFLEGAGAL